MERDERAKRITLIRLLKSLGARRKGGSIPPQRYPQHIADGYFAALRGLLVPMREAAEGALLPKVAAWERAQQARTDAPDKPDKPPDLKADVERVKSAFLGRLDKSRDKLAALAKGTATRTAAFQAGQLRGQMRAAVGVELPIKDGALGKQVDAFVADNVGGKRGIVRGLVQTIATRYFDQLGELVREAGTSGMRPSTLAKLIEDRYGVAESNAKRIANDQVGKFNASVNRVRQIEAGITRYIWRTVRDNRVRDEHDDLEGESFEWENGPAEGHPGEAGVNCRCYSEPDFSQALRAAA